MTYKVGLTGGIGSGKSTVAQLFGALGVPEIDADLVARNLVRPGEPALKAIVDVFGKNVLLDDGELNRSLLKDLVFSDEGFKRQLENIIHPLVYAEMQKQVDKLSAMYTILSIPLLFETNRQNFVDRILVVDCSEDLQLERIKIRDSLSEDAAIKIMKSQVARQYRLSSADDVIENSGEEAALDQQVTKLDAKYRHLASAILT